MQYMGDIWAWNLTDNPARPWCVFACLGAIEFWELSEWASERERPVLHHNNCFPAPPLPFVSRIASWEMSKEFAYSSSPSPQFCLKSLESWASSLPIFLPPLPLLFWWKPCLAVGCMTNVPLSGVSLRLIGTLPQARSQTIWHSDRLTRWTGQLVSDILGLIFSYACHAGQYLCLGN